MFHHDEAHQHSTDWHGCGAAVAVCVVASPRPAPSSSRGDRTMTPAAIAPSSASKPIRLAAELARCRTVTLRASSSARELPPDMGRAIAGTSLRQKLDATSSRMLTTRQSDIRRRRKIQGSGRLPQGWPSVPTAERVTLMGGTGVIDRFLEVFTRYIDSGFGLLQRRSRLSRHHAGRDRYHARGDVLELGRATKTSSRAS